MFISSRKESKEELDLIHKSIFNYSSTKVKDFEELCEKAYSFIPSERCKGKKCVLGYSSGNLDSKIMFIAEAPGRNGAERTGIPLYGDPSGDNFEKILLEASKNKITRKDVYITNSFLWNPTDINGNNSRPTEDEINSSLFLLKEQIKIINPELIIVLGLTAYNTLGKIHPLPIEGSLKDLTRKVYKWNGIFLGIMYHPSPRVIGIHRSMEDMILDLRGIYKDFIKKRNEL